MIEAALHGRQLAGPARAGAVGGQHGQAVGAVSRGGAGFRRLGGPSVL